MQLSVKERVILLNILPAEGDVLSLRIVRKLREALSFSEEEQAALGFHQDDTRLGWNTEAEQPKDVEIGPKAHAIIADTLKRLSSQKKLHESHLDLYERFVTEE